MIITTDPDLPKTITAEYEDIWHCVCDNWSTWLASILVIPPDVRWSLILLSVGMASSYIAGIADW
jgi:hypothetical protein